MNQSAANPRIAKLLDGIASADQLAAIDANKRVTGLCLDSRDIREGSMFLAVPGLVHDGRDYAADAISAGAAAVVFERDGAPDLCQQLVERGSAVGVDNLCGQASLIAGRFFNHPSRALYVIGVTGTNGKTTCAYLLAHALKQLGQQAGMLGTIGSGPVDQLQASRLTTADAIAVQKDLARLRDARVEAVCMEVSSHGLDQHRVDGVAFDLALFTNLSQDHLDYHGDMTRYGDAKKRLFSMPGLKAIVINADDKLGASLIAEEAAAGTVPQLITYGQRGDLRATRVECRESGLQFEVSHEGETVTISSQLIGAINVPNLLGVIGCLLAMNHQLDQIAKIVPALIPPPGRMERFQGRSDKPVVVVDYAHTPDSLERALNSLRDHVSGELWLVFGCGGDRDPGKRPLMGRIAARLADQIIVTNDNPRGEDPALIAAAIAAGIEQERPEKHYMQILDRRLAISTAMRTAAAGDLILIAGKGHERTQTIGDTVLPFSDRDLVMELYEVVS